MKEKYENLDVRTGFAIGEIVELDLDELNRVPFNVCLKKVRDLAREKEEEDKKFRESEEAKEKEKLVNSLREKGLSRLRVEKVVEKAKDIVESVKFAEGGEFDELTNKFLVNNFEIKKKKRGED